MVDYIAEFLPAQRLRHVFGVGGANIEDLYDAVHHAGAPLRALVAKHEFSAAAMADGHFRASGEPAVVVATSGAGAMNLVPGIAELRASCVPALVLIGQPPARLDGRGSFQETSGRAGSIDALRLFSEIGVHCARVEDPESITTLLPAAWEAAQRETPGPAVLLLPKDVQQSVITPWRAPVPVLPAPRPLTADAVRRVAVRTLLDARGAGEVVVIAGRGVARSGARDELARLSDLLDAPVAVAPDARDVFDNGHHDFLGVTGAIGHHSARRRITGAAAVLLIGTRLPQLAGGDLRDHLKGLPVVALGADPPFLDDAHPGVLHLDGPLREEIAALTGELDSARRVGRAPARTARPPGPPEPPAEPAAGATLTMRDAVAVLAPLLPDGATVVVDAGNCGATVIHHLPTPRGGRHIVAQGMGGMGHSFGAAVGASLATGAPTYVIAGDGSFLMHGLEVHTAAELGLPITYLVLNNNAHAMCHTREQVFFAADYSYNLFGPARIADGVGALLPGVTARHARDATELRAALAETAPGGGPRLISVDVDPRETPPFEPFRRREAPATP
ncbi:thiamine pyrophosphate-binding protein [Streptomyces sp. SM14]|uniref:thiamine pyrophosphate-binding protein n=3 Tax=Streptomyces TaxID=1883 RepID=UPI001CA597C0|nr:thiamine pyrophosphate-binding protein [Streptomyces sp. SM14]